MSTRAIAPVVGVSNKTVHKDREAIQSGVTEVTPEPEPTVNTETGEVSDPPGDFPTPRPAH